MGARLTKPTTIPELPFLPFTAERRTAWEYVLPTLAPYTATWKSILRIEADVLDLERWAATQR
jgi:hypothetical protein